MPIRFIRIATFAAGLSAGVIGVMAAPAAAQDAYPDLPMTAAVAPVAEAARPMIHYHPDQREQWLSACEARQRTQVRNRRGRAWCEAYLDQALADYNLWYATLPPPPVAASLLPAPVPQRQCTETTTVTTEEAAAPARRVIPRRQRAIPARDKRIRLY